MNLSLLELLTTESIVRVYFTLLLEEYINHFAVPKVLHGAINRSVQLLSLPYVPQENDTEYKENLSPYHYVECLNKTPVTQSGIIPSKLGN